jgi:hypothetical protein
MPIQTIDLGNYANDGTGDDLRTAFEKVNYNFSQLSQTTVNNAANLGAGAPVYASKTGETLNFRSLVAGSNTTISYDANTITINTGGGFLFEDLNLNNNSIIGNGNINFNGNLTVGNNGLVTLGSVNNVKISGGANGQVLSTDGLGNLSWISQTGGGGDLDFGTFITPAGFSLDLGVF